MHWALGASLALHAALLTVRLVDPDAFDRVFEEQPLDVVLVNARSEAKPKKARAIAQANLDGGGEHDSGRATSPLPPAMVNASGDAMEDAQRQIDELQEQQSQMLAQIRSELRAMPPAEPSKAQSPTEQSREDRRRQLVALLAEIERRVNDENARPKKRYISPATREEIYALYYDAMRRRIEDRGTVDFPQLAGNKLYGRLTMLLTVNFDGRVLGTQVLQSSGNAALDRRAEAIARSAGPFKAFSAEMRQRADQLVLVSQFRFTREETLETRLGNR